MCITFHNDVTITCFRHQERWLINLQLKKRKGRTMLLTGGGEVSELHAQTSGVTLQTIYSMVGKGWRGRGKSAYNAVWLEFLPIDYSI